MTRERNPSRRIAGALVLTAAAAAIAFVPAPHSRSAPQHVTQRIEAAQFAFTPSQIKVNQGDTVTLELVSDDVVHGLYVDRYDVSVAADPGQTAQLTFVAAREGSFRIRCNVSCGQYHPFMIGRLTVGTPLAFWRAAALSVLALAALLIARNRGPSAVLSP